ncbi:MAG TPA: hypothetical protein VGK06_12815 [Methanosarcina sp.]|jgi:hypothetical protein
MVSENLRLIATYVDVETYNKIEATRRHISRSAFVANVLTDVFSDVEISHNVPSI